MTTDASKPPPGLIRDLKAALATLRGRRAPLMDADNRRRWAALQLRMAAARLESGIYEPAGGGALVAILDPLETR